MNRIIYYQRVKLYVSREQKLDKNIGKIFMYIWVKCTSALESMVKGDKYYEDKEYGNDCIWLLEKVKLMKSGLYKKANKCNNLHGTIIYFITMKQGETEINDAYMRSLK